jgi:hypothetical protein
MHRTPSSLRGRLDTNNLRTSETKIMNQSMINFDEFGCQIGTMPFTYLGLPLGITKPQIHDLLPLVCRLERKLTSSSSFLPQGAMLQLINSALASMPLHYLCTLSLPPGVTKQFDRILRQCLWRDFYGEPKQSLAAWSMVCRPKKCGGLGIVDFQKQNAALLIKFLDKFYYKVDIPWVHLIWYEYYLDTVPHWEKLKGSFWWRDVFKQVDNYRGVTSINIGRGDTALFWSGSWLLDGCHTPLRDRFPWLFTFVLDEGLSAAQVYNKEDFSSLFYLPLSREAFDEYSQLQQMMSSNGISDQPDEWVCCWGGRYTSAKFYKHIHSHVNVLKVFHWLWKSSCVMSAKFFAWLVLQDHLNTCD